MSDTFNGYHVWLGIPLKEQPPNHYRLLGITLFETDIDVIDHAADRQMAHVRTFQSGRNGTLSQQILNELAAARVCLLNAAKKAEYDAQLRSELPQPDLTAGVLVAKAVPIAKPLPQPPKAPAAPPHVPTARPVSPAASRLGDDLQVDLDLANSNSLESLSDFATAPAFNMRSRRRRPDSAPTWRQPIGLSLIAVLVVVVLVILYHLVQFLIALSGGTSNAGSTDQAPSPPARMVPVDATKPAPPPPQPERNAPTPD